MDELTRYLTQMTSTVPQPAPESAYGMNDRGGAVTDSLGTRLGTAYRNFANRLDAQKQRVVQGVTQPVRDFADAAQGTSATRNAVVGANNAAGAQPGGSFDMSADVGVSSRSAVPGTAGVVELGNGIVRRGNTYSNMGVAGLDDIDNKRGTTPSAAAFLNRVPNGNISPPLAQSATEALPTFDTQPHAGQIASLESEAAPLLRSRGIASNYQGRLLMRQARNLSAQDIARTGAQASLVNADANARVSRNQLPIAQMRNAAELRQQDLGLLPHLPRMALDNAQVGAVQRGDYATAREIGTLGQLRYPPNPLAPHVSGDVATGIAIVNPYTYETTVKTPQQLQADAERQRQQDAARMILGQ